MKLRNITREEFISAITEDRADGFANTFKAKADMQELWGNCVGLFDGDELAGAIIVSYSKRQPVIANLQLLHTFAKHRRKGVARKLCDHALQEAKKVAKYLRVSAEKPAIPFYESIGMIMLGEQKSGCQLSMCRLQGDTWADCAYDLSEEPIRKAVYKKGKGGCVNVFFEKKDELTVYFS